MFIRNPPKQVSSVFMHSSSWLLYLLLIPQQPRLGKSFHLHYIQHLSMWRMRSAHFAFTYDLHNGKHNHLLRAGYRLSGEIMACTERAMGQQKLQFSVFLSHKCLKKRKWYRKLVSAPQTASSWAHWPLNYECFACDKCHENSFAHLTKFQCSERVSLICGTPS